MITYQVEKYADVIDEIWPLLEDHYQEIATDKHMKPFDPDLARYQSMEDQDMLRIFTARAAPHPTDNKDYFNGKPVGLIGYFVTVILPGLHYQQTLMAINDIMYIMPEHRGGTVGYRLLKLATEDLKNLGADILTIHMKTEYPFRSLLAKLGFHLTEENWEKVLNEPQPHGTTR
jgi:GNAT superfamily N-acetyltransferase